MRKPIPRPILRKDVEIATIEREIRAKLERLVKLSTDERMTFYWNGQTNWLRNQGMLLPGDGKGGLIKPKRED